MAELCLKKEEIIDLFSKILNPESVKGVFGFNTKAKRVD